MRLVDEPWRGTFMGNRGGRIHDPASKTLLKRKWASKRWIICVTEFKNRQREVMGKGYTELFFLDEVSALAAGHRPCFECRRPAAKLYADIWQSESGAINGSVADCMDNILHRERTGKRKLLDAGQIAGLPDGTMIRSGNQCLAKFQGQFHVWSGTGYLDPVSDIREARLLTPPSTMAVLANGYKPTWHPGIR